MSSGAGTDVARVSASSRAVAEADARSAPSPVGAGSKSDASATSAAGSGVGAGGGSGAPRGADGTWAPLQPSGDARGEVCAPFWGRSFVSLGDWPVESQDDNPRVLCVASFNILAQSRSQLSQFPYCANVSLTWTIRREQLLAEILGVDADILLLQDVDNFAEWWQPQLRDEGYDGIFEKQTGRSRVGVAVLFKRELFNLFRSECIVLDRLTEDLPASEGTRAKQGNVGVMLLLQPWEQCVHPTALLAVSLQLTPGVGFRELRRWQLKYAFKQIQRFNMDFAVPVLMGITTEEEPSTPLYHMLATGFMPQLPRRPRRPERPTATVLSMASARVDWKPPFDPGDGEVLCYRVEKRAGGNKVVGFVISCTVPPNQTYAIITGLSSGLSYEFHVAAVNKYGVGMYSTPSIPITMPVPRGRSAVNFIELRRLSNHSVMTEATVASHFSVANDTASGLSPRFDGGGVHRDAPPTRPAPILGPVCDEHCRSHHTKRIHYLELNSAYSMYRAWAPKTAAAMDEFKFDKVAHAEETLETTKYSVSLKRPGTAESGVTDLSLSSGSDDDSDGDASRPSTAKDRAAEAGRRGAKAAASSGRSTARSSAAGSTSRPRTAASVSFADGVGQEGEGEGEGKGKEEDEGSKEFDSDAAIAAARAADAMKRKPGTPSDHMSKTIGSFEPPVVRPTRSMKVPSCDTFLMYTRGGLEMKSIMSLLSPEEIRALDPKQDLPYLPNRKLSSDHQMLAARFTINKSHLGSVW